MSATLTSRPLDPTLTFDNYCTGPENEKAAEAAFTVANAPRNFHNPLIIYTPVGGGKTHLLNAIGNHVRTAFPEKSVGLIDAPTLVEMVEAGELEELTRWDVLLIDDLVTLTEVTDVQMRLLDALLNLSEKVSQVVVTNQSSQEFLPELIKTIQSQFPQGELVAVENLDTGTKIEILRRKAGADRVAVPDDVLALLASATDTDNVRVLLGLWMRLVAFAALKEEGIGMPLARECLRDFLSEFRDDEHL